MNRSIIFALTFCAVWFDPHTVREATAQAMCDKRADIVQHLGTKYHEAPVAQGLANNGGLLEVLRTTDGTTWTVMVSMPNGISCLLAAGESWTDVIVETVPGEQL